MSSTDDMAKLSLFELFAQEARSQAQVLSDGLLALERAPSAPELLEACMRAAHSLKGAARIVGVPLGVEVAHAMEECFVAAQQASVVLKPTHIDVLLRGVDLLLTIAQAEPAAPALHAEAQEWLAALKQQMGAPGAAAMPAMAGAGAVAAVAGRGTPAVVAAPATAAASATAATTTPVAAATQPPLAPASPTAAPGAVATRTGDETGERQLRVSAERLDRLLGFSGEALVESRGIKPVSLELLRIKRTQREASRALNRLRDALPPGLLDEQAAALLEQARELMNTAQTQLAQRIETLENFDRRFTNLSQQIYDEALASRMRPFSDGVGAYARLVRDLARSIGKQASLEVIGAGTQIDRDILEMLDAPLGHLLRNALDHGIETPQARLAAGKPAEGRLVLEAGHSAGTLHITVSDDGAGIDLASLRASVVRKRLVSAEMVQHLSESELLEFLFLPGFSLRDTVTELSGRGVGLDAVRNALTQVRGVVRVAHTQGMGTRFTLQLPLTLSVIRSLLVEIGGEAYAFPLAFVDRTLQLPREQIETLEGHSIFALEGRQIGIVPAHQILETAPLRASSANVELVLIGKRHDMPTLSAAEAPHAAEAAAQRDELYGLVVDRFLGERMLVVQPLDRRLGKVKDIAAGALLENGDPVLILDVEDLLRSVQKLITEGRLDRVKHEGEQVAAAAHQRVLVVDDSLTVRELERKLLVSRGYEVSVALDGMDAWNVLHTQAFDLVVTDVDMPRMDGIELVRLIKNDHKLKMLPVLIVSYKDRAEDRQRGLEAGADYYLSKGSFHDETLIDAVRDLIGEARA
jgi:two-component system sensor histidine kinase and response regulator WspE